MDKIIGIHKTSAQWNVFNNDDELKRWIIANGFNASSEWVFRRIGPKLTVAGAASDVVIQ